MLAADQRQNDMRLLELQHRHSLASVKLCKPEYVKTHWQRANEIISETVLLMRPWLTKEGLGTAARGDYSQMLSAWESHFGKMDDPETERKNRETVKFLEQHTAK